MLRNKHQDVLDFMRITWATLSDIPASKFWYTPSSDPLCGSAIGFELDNGDRFAEVLPINATVHDVHTWMLKVASK